MQPALTSPFRIGDVEIANRVLLAPLAGIGNWFVRLQAQRHGAGMAVSEMVSSFAIHYGNEKTLRELLRIHPRASTPVSRPALRPGPRRHALGRGDRRRARRRRRHRPQHGLPGAEGLQDRRGRGAARGSRHRGRGRRGRPEGSGLPGDGASCARARQRRPQRLRPGPSGWSTEAGVAAIGFHPRSAVHHHKGCPTTTSPRQLVGALGCHPVISPAACTRRRGTSTPTFARTGATAVMLARGSLGNPWLFEQLLGRRARIPPQAARRSSPSGPG